VKQFENEVSPVLSLPDFDPSLTTYIRDSMALVQCMDAKKSSLLLAKTRARLKTISGLISPVMISPDLHFRDVLAFMCSNVFNFDFEIGL
jgi:hypothetical protein